MNSNVPSANNGPCMPPQPASTPTRRRTTCFVMMASLSFDQVIEKINEPLVVLLPPLAVYVKGRSAPQKAELRVADQQGWLSLRFDLELLLAVVGDVNLPEEI